MYDMRNLKHSTLDDHELGTRIKYYVLHNGEIIHMIQNKDKNKINVSSVSS